MDQSKYRWYALTVLALTYAFSVMDRQILAIVLEDLRAEFSLTDTQLGLLSGLAFALLYATLGIPIARLADRSNRVNIISIAVAAWSLATIICGTVTSYGQLFLARVGVGIGEAGGGPPSHSLISDYFEPGRRSLAISIYSLGVSLGAVFGLVLGGFVAEYYGWRMVFIVAGVPGILLAILVKLTVREPPRGQFDEKQKIASTAPGFAETIRLLWQNLVYRRVLIGHTMAVLVAYAIFSWLAALYMRQFDLSQSVVGSILGGINLFFGVPGLLVGGYLADKIGQKDPKWRIRIPAIALCFALPFYLIGIWQDNYIVMSVLIGFGMFAYMVSHGPGLAVVQLVVPANMRAQAAAYIFFFSNLVGLGLGPVIVGSVSDLDYFDSPGDSLAFGISITIVFMIGAIRWYWIAGSVMDEDGLPVRQR